MNDGYNTAMFINKMFDIECSADEAIEIEQHLFKQMYAEIALLKAELEEANKEENKWCAQVIKMQAELAEANTKISALEDTACIMGGKNAEEMQVLRDQLAKARAEVFHLEMLRDIDRKALDEQLAEVERLKVIKWVQTESYEAVAAVQQARQDVAREIISDLVEWNVLPERNIGYIKQKFGLEG